MMYDTHITLALDCVAGEDCPWCVSRLRRGTWGEQSNDPAAWIWPGESRSEDEYITAEEEHEASEWKDDYFPTVRAAKAWNIRACDIIEHPILGRWDNVRGLFYTDSYDPDDHHMAQATARARALARDARARVLADLYLAERLEPREPEPNPEKRARDAVICGLLQGASAELGRHVARQLDGYVPWLL